MTLGIALFSFGVFAPSITAAEFWSREQQEVWNTLMEINRSFEEGDIKSGYKRIHSGYVYWDTSRPRPLSYDQVKRLDTHTWGNLSRHSQRVCIPLTIDVYIEFAVVNADCRGFLQYQDGAQSYYSVRKNMVLKREGRLWLLVSSTDDDFID